MKNFKALGIIALALMAVAAAPGESDRFHFALQRSVPAADATVTPPAEIQLWFTQVPQAGSLSVRVVDGSGDLVATEEPKAHGDDAKAFTMKVGRQLTAGAYTVSWRGIGDDGHVVRDEFGFNVSSAVAGGAR